MCLVYFLRKLEEEGLDGMVKIALHWTVKRVDPQMCRQLHYKSESKRDPVTGLKARTFFGRPAWRTLLETIGRVHEDVGRIGVFFCGPPSGCSSLRRACLEESQKSLLKFDFLPDLFS